MTLTIHSDGNGLCTVHIRGTNSGDIDIINIDLSKNKNVSIEINNEEGW